MVVRTRVRAIVLPILFYLVLGTASSYLVWGASQGDRGLKAKAADAADAILAQKELDATKTERARWERRVAALSSQSIDRDLLDEEAHRLLDHVGKDELAIFPDARAR